MARLPSTMTASQFDAALQQLGISVYASAKVLCISLRQAQRSYSIAIHWCHDNTTTFAVNVFVGHGPPHHHQR